MQGYYGYGVPHLACALVVLGDGILPNVYGMHQNTRIGAAFGAGSVCASV